MQLFRPLEEVINNMLPTTPYERLLEAATLNKTRGTQQALIGTTALPNTFHPRLPAWADLTDQIKKLGYTTGQPIIYARDKEEDCIDPPMLDIQVKIIVIG